MEGGCRAGEEGDGRGMPLIEGQGVSRFFGGVKALNQVSFGVEQEAIVGLIGPNGAGKTTLFNVIGGTIKPTSGRILFHAVDITGQPAYAVCRKGIARTFQIPRPFGTMTCLENVLTGIINNLHEPYARSVAEDRAQGLLKFVGLGEHASVEARNLNVIQKKRLEIARALATEPELLLLDEVLGGLNTQEIGEAVDFIRRLRDEKRLTIFWIEHIMGAVMQAAERVIVLDQGAVLMDGSPQEVVKDRRVIRAYLGE